MKNILMVTPLYPLPTKENNCTYVCHFFTREWVKMGYNVMVIHAQPVHCRAWHLLVKLFCPVLMNIMGGGNYYARRIKDTEHYVMDEVPVYRVPIYNSIPHGRYPEKSMDAFIGKVQGILEANGFVPDCIVGHGLVIEVIPLLNKSYNAKTVMVLHGIPKKLDERYDDYASLIDSYSAFGFRSAAIRQKFESKYKTVRNPFLCLSGVPESQITESNRHIFHGPLTRFLYVGDLIERKYPLSLLEAVPAASDGDFSIRYIGSGPERKKLLEYVSANNLAGKVEFLGQVPRGKVPEYMDGAECLIMISRREAYGLVYLEAMARGCIVIASRNEGFDGIIVDGKNGFLCAAGDSAELASTIKRINALSDEEKMTVSANALQTAKSMSDYEMARDYIEKLELIP